MAKPLDFTLTCQGCGQTIRIHCMDTDWDPIYCPHKCGTAYGLSRGNGREWKMIVIGGPSVETVAVDTRKVT